MVISQTTMNRFWEVQWKDFEDRVVKHLNRCFPEASLSFEEPEFRQLIRDSSHRAEYYGFCHERDVCKFIDLAFLFGVDFDRDPALDWAPAILLDPDYDNPSERIDNLYGQGMACYGLTRGGNGD